MQIGRLARHARQQAPDLCQRPRGASTSRGLIRLVCVPPVLAAGRGGRGAAGPAAPIRPAAGHSWQRDWPVPGALPGGQRGNPGPCTNPMTTRGWHGAVGEGASGGIPSTLGCLRRSPPHSSTRLTSHVGLAATATLSIGDETGGEGARASAGPRWHHGEYGTHTGDDPLSHCHSGQQSPWP